MALVLADPRCRGRRVVGRLRPVGSLWFGCAAFIALGYVLGPPLWSPTRAGAAHGRSPAAGGPGRRVPVALAKGGLRLGAMTGLDWLLIAALVLLHDSLRADAGAAARRSAVKPWWRLIAAFWIPAASTWRPGRRRAIERTWRAMLWVLAGAGRDSSRSPRSPKSGKQWWAVFPRYIADPLLGTHFGRARGPALNSASLGV